LVLLALVAGCAHYPCNPELKKFDPQAGYRFGNCASRPEDDATFIVLAFSGGGTRAAAFSYGLLEKLRTIPLPQPAGAAPRSLLDEVDVISSVSGGSFTAAYYGLYRDRIFDGPEFKQRLLYHNVQGDLILKLLNPVNLWKLASPTYSRIELAAEYYDRHLFENKTFAAMPQQKRRPFVIINATDMSLGARFEFTQSQFDLLMSDLNRFKVARAVAASSAFPLLLTPVAVDNHPKGDLREPQWVADAIEDLERSPRRWRMAMNIRSYFDLSRKHIHLLDGGISDNLGVRGPIQSLVFFDPIVLEDGKPHPDDKELSILRLVNDHKIKRLVFIIADAKPGDSDTRDESARTPGFLDVGLTAGSAPIANFSFESVQLLQEIKTEFKREKDDPELQKLKMYMIHLRFDSIENPHIRRCLQGLGTNFNLPASGVNELRKQAGELLEKSKEFGKLMEDLKKEAETATSPVRPPG